VLITCTGSEQAIVDVDLFKHAYNGSNNRKVVLDLAVPQDIHPDVIAMFNVDYISVESLREIAKANLKTREKEVFRCEELVEQRLAEFVEVFRTRKLELAMQKVPSIMKEIKTNAIEKTFASRLMTMSDEDREITLEMLNYLEKKYVSVPMKIAKEVILDQDLKDSVSE
jgi:glutamyl-tRNA reductase